MRNILITLFCLLLLVGIAKGSDYDLQRQIVNEQYQRMQGDNIINGKVNNETYTRYQEDKKLYKKINEEGSERYFADKVLDNKILNNADSVSTIKNSIGNVENRIDKLEETDINLELNIRIIDTKKIEIKICNTYDIKHKKNSSIGASITYKLGKSYEEKKIEELENLIKILLKNKEE